jgi:plastocyanin
MKNKSILCGFFSALLLSGCGGTKTETPSPAASTAAATLKIEEATAGSISGKVAFTGAAPAARPIDMSATEACADAHKTPLTAEDVIVNGNHTLKNVFIRVKSGLPEGTWPVPDTPVVLDQNGCMYTPRVLGVMVNQPVRFENSDPTNHNIHPLPRVNREWNESQPPKGVAKLKQFDKPEVMVPVKCNIHPWMRAYIGVVDHPFFAVTGDDGSFTIKGLPPGKYIVEAWHERYGSQNLEVTIAPKENKSVDFQFKAQLSTASGSVRSLPAQVLKPARKIG